MTTSSTHTRPLLCATVTAPTTAELRARRDQARGDLVELRLDTVSDPDVAGALAGRRQPAVVTCRASWEGGSFKGSEEERHGLLKQALALGAEYVDVEWRAGFTELIDGTRGKRIVLSSHDFSGIPDDLNARADAMRATGAEIIKIAAKANRLSDCLPLLEIGRAGHAVVIAMGDAGLATRVLAVRFGSAWTYAGALAEVGQISADALLDEFRFHRISSATDVYGLVGSPIAHSVSPAMHNAAFAASGRDAVYLPLPAVDADDFLAFARGLGLRGASVTIPFKVAFFDLVDEADDMARQIGALNTIRVIDGDWAGRNTDVAGFLQPLDERNVNLRGTRASILGAGGSARAVALGLQSRGSSVTVHARHPERGAAVAANVGARSGAWPPDPDSWDLLVNCTPIGMHPHDDGTPLPEPLLRGGVVYDLVYNPVQTRLLREAAHAGCQTIGGLDMLVGQAVEQLAWWTGERPDPGVMRAAAIKRLAEFTQR